ncbi:MAG: hypothetical protein CMJ49_00945 [Planctomycetaceae bacterium]|nr:hypothetical protein [Planctomycetaceae bacterium]
MNAMNHIACWSLVAVVTVGCTHLDAQRQSRHDPQQIGPRLSEAEALGIADGFAKEIRDEHEPFDLKSYPDRTAVFDEEDAAWWVHYVRRPNRHLGDHFGIRVDDVSGTTEFFGGK